MRIMDAREATRTVKDYFREVHGDHGCIAFQVATVERSEDNEPGWVVNCSFYLSIHDIIQAHYTVRVREDGSIGSVVRLDSGAIPGDA